MRVIPSLFILLAVTTAGCVGNAIDPAVSETGTPASADPWQRVHVFDGEIAPAEGAAVFAFEVPDGAAEVEALLTWKQPGAALAFRLLSPGGEEAARGWGEADGRRYVTTTHAVVPGTWELEVTSERPVTAAFAATVTVHSEAVPEGPISTTFVIPPRNPARELPSEVRGATYSFFPRDYAEVNLNMAPGDWFNFSWTASGPVYFNVHYHGEDGTERPIEHRGDALVGEFTASMTEVYALLWRNEGTTEVEVELDMDGAYRLHSMTRRS